MNSNTEEVSTELEIEEFFSDNYDEEMRNFRHARNFDCPMCLFAFDDKHRKPKILSQCGHSVCQQCAKQPSKWNEIRKINCPECRLETEISNNEGLATNFPLLRVISSFSGKRNAPDADDLCLHVALTVKPNTCHHCSAKFCDACSLRHMDRVRTTATWHASNFDRRLQPARQWLKENGEALKNLVENDAKEAKEAIIKASQQLQRAILSAIREARQIHLQEVATKRAEKLRKIDALFNAVARLDDVRSELDNINAISFLQLSNEEVQTTFRNVQEADTKLFDIESLMDSQDSIGRVIFNQTKTTQAELVRWASSEMGSIGSYKFSEDRINLLAFFETSDRKAKLPTVPYELHVAAKNGNLAAMKEAMKALPPSCRKLALQHCEANDKNKKTILHQAAENGNAELVEYLVKELGGDLFVKSADDVGSLPIHLAADGGQLEVVKFMAKFCPDLAEFEDAASCTPLYRAAKFGNLNVVEFLVEEMKVDVDAQNVNERTPLIAAAAGGHLSVVKCLVEKGKAFVACSDEECYTAMHIAVDEFKPDVVKYLYEAEPSLVAEEGPRGWLPLHFAASKGNLEIAKFLLRKAAYIGRGGSDEAVVETINYKDDFGNTPLILAAEAGNASIVKFLVDNGADVDIENDQSKTAIHCAAANGMLAVVEYLLDQYPELLHLKNRNGETALRLAEKEEHQQIVQFLRQKLAD